MKLRNKKTGEIIEYDEEVIYYRKLTPNSHEDWTPCHPEDWEDYTPAEPLIDDKKLRNIIKEWCEYYHISRLQYCPLYENEGHYLVNESGRYSIDVDIDCLTQFEFYTVEELCG